MDMYTLFCCSTERTRHILEEQSASLHQENGFLWKQPRYRSSLESHGHKPLASRYYNPYALDARMPFANAECIWLGWLVNADHFVDPLAPLSYQSGVKRRICRTCATFLGSPWRKLLPAPPIYLCSSSASLMIRTHAHRPTHLAARRLTDLPVEFTGDKRQTARKRKRRLNQGLPVQIMTHLYLMYSFIKKTVFLYAQ